MKINFQQKLISFFLIVIPSLLLSQSINNDLYKIIVELDKDRVIKDAEIYLLEKPVTITSFIAERSTGGINDFYSEGDYWWPDPENPDGPYIRKDGLTNPDNFTAHREAMRRLSIHVPVLIAAFKISGDKKYSDHAVKHLLAWFVDENTMMNPHMKFAQAIKGKVTGRGIGIIDAIHLVEVVQSVMVLEKEEMIDKGNLEKIKNWFTDFSDWLMNDQYGVDERDNENNHSTCWNMQVAQYAKFINDGNKLKFCRDHFKQELLPKQMENDGSFPLELKRTKPYGYSLFNLDAMVMVAEILSDSEDNLWEFKTSDGKKLKDAVDFMFPYIKDKSSWSFQKDVVYFDQWPVRHPSLLFASIAYNEDKYLKTWAKLNPAPTKDEVLRNFFIRQPILWIE